MVSLRTIQAALAIFNAGDLFGFTVRIARVIEDNRSGRRIDNLVFGLLPQQARRWFLDFQIAINAVMV